MKLGLITDIHEQVELLRLALDRFDRERVDQVVVVGDVFEMGKRIEETCRLLSQVNAIGVWGNHDYGLCVDPDENARATYSVAVIDYMTSLRPRLEVGGSHFTHVEPWLNSGEIAESPGFRRTACLVAWSNARRSPPRDGRGFGVLFRPAEAARRPSWADVLCGRCNDCCPSSRSIAATGGVLRLPPRADEPTTTRPRSTTAATSPRSATHHRPGRDTPPPTSDQSRRTATSAMLLRPVQIEYPLTPPLIKPPARNATPQPMLQARSPVVLEPLPQSRSTCR